MPTVLRIGRYRFHFYSNEGQEPPHIHVKAGSDQAKFWLEPVALAANYGFRGHELNEIEDLVADIKRHCWEPGMNTLVKKSTEIRRAFVPTTALACKVAFDQAMMYVSLIDGRVIGVPTIWFPILHEATPAQREQYEIGGGGVSLHWPELDEDLSVANFLAGADWQST